MRRAAIALLLAGCSSPIYHNGLLQCPPHSVDLGGSCVEPLTMLVVTLGSVAFWIWILACIITTRSAVGRIEAKLTRIEKKLSERREAPPESPSRS